jgi:hypothetical protein
MYVVVGARGNNIYALIAIEINSTASNVFGERVKRVEPVSFDPPTKRRAGGDIRRP